MTDPDQNDLPELELDPVESEASHETPSGDGEEGSQTAAPADAADAAEDASEGASEDGCDQASGAVPAGASPVSEGEPLLVSEAPAETAETSDAEGGQWVWQYAAPPPQPSFSAVFFSGTALPELYRFFACGLLVVLGCFLPWGPSLGAGEGAGEVLLPLPEVLGVQTTLGALSLIIGLWLVFSSCYSIYTRRQKILPVFLMLEPAVVSWMRLLETRGQAGEMGFSQMLDAAGTGVLLTLIGSTLVSVQFFFVIGKVYTKKDDKGAGRRASKGGGTAKARAKGKTKGKKGEQAGDDGQGKGAKDKGGKGRRGRQTS